MKNVNSYNKPFVESSSLHECNDRCKTYYSLLQLELKKNDRLEKKIAALEEQLAKQRLVTNRGAGKKRVATLSEEQYKDMQYRGLTREEMAKEIGVTTSTIYRYIRILKRELNEKRS